MLPGDAATLHELGLALEKLGRLEEAWGGYQQSVLGGPQAPGPHFDLGRLTAPQGAEAPAAPPPAHQRAGQPECALESYRRALHLAPTHTEWSLGLGQVC